MCVGKCIATKIPQKSPVEFARECHNLKNKNAGFVLVSETQITDCSSEFRDFSSFVENPPTLKYHPAGIPRIVLILGMVHAPLLFAIHRLSLLR